MEKVMTVDMKIVISFCVSVMSVIVLMGIFSSGDAEASSSLRFSLIQPEALNNQNGFIILDGRPEKEWQTGHIPGAISLNWENVTATDKKNIPYRLLPVRQLADRLGKLGISETDTVVIYGDADSSWGGEGWLCWMFSYLGHQGDLSLLDGGIQGWQSQGFALSKQEKKRKPSVYTARVNKTIMISTSQLKSSLKTLQIVDTRSTLEWFRGSIPGAVHINWKKLYSGKNKTIISPESFRKLLAGKNIDPDKPVVYYCTGGVRSAYAWTAHTLAGFSTPVNYEGGMVAWKAFDQL